MRRTVLNHLRTRHSIPKADSVKMDIRKVYPGEVPQEIVEKSISVSLIQTEEPLEQNMLLFDVSHDESKKSFKTEVEKPVLQAIENPVKPENDLLCLQCDRKFENINEKIVHYEAVHLKVRYECPICSKLFSIKRAVGIHAQEQHGLTKSEALDLNTPKVTSDANEKNKFWSKCSECPLCDAHYLGESDSPLAEIVLKNHLIQKHKADPEKINKINFS